MRSDSVPYARKYEDFPWLQGLHLRVDHLQQTFQILLVSRKMFYSVLTSFYSEKIISKWRFNISNLFNIFFCTNLLFVDNIFLPFRYVRNTAGFAVLPPIGFFPAFTRPDSFELVLRVLDVFRNLSVTRYSGNLKQTK